MTVQREKSVPEMTTGKHEGQQTIPILCEVHPWGVPLSHSVDCLGQDGLAVVGEEVSSEATYVDEGVAAAAAAAAVADAWGDATGP